MLLGQVGQDVGVEQRDVKEAAPQRCQLGAELAHVPADLLRHLLVAFLQLMKGERVQKSKDDAVSERVRFDLLRFAIPGSAPPTQNLRWA